MHSVLPWCFILCCGNPALTKAYIQIYEKEYGVLHVCSNGSRTDNETFVSYKVSNLWTKSDIGNELKRLKCRKRLSVFHF